MRRQWSILPPTEDPPSPALAEQAATVARSGGVAELSIAGPSREVVSFVRLWLLDDSDQIGGIGEVTIVHRESRMNVLRLRIDSIDSLGVELGRTALDAVYHVTFGEEQPGKVGAVLPRDTGDERSLHLVAVRCWSAAVIDCSAPGPRPA